MDTSEQYIKMCEKAGDIQKLVNKPIGLLGAPCDTGGIVLGVRSHDFVGFVWLPRQDQLQEMVERFNSYAYPVRGLIDGFYEFVSNERDWKKYITIEQLWLVFTMKERFRKIWNGEEWING